MNSNICLIKNVYVNNNVLHTQFKIKDYAFMHSTV